MQQSSDFRSMGDAGSFCPCLFKVFQNDIHGEFVFGMAMFYQEKTARCGGNGIVEDFWFDLIIAGKPKIVVVLGIVNRCIEFQMSGLLVFRTFPSNEDDGKPVGQFQIDK